MKKLDLKKTSPAVYGLLADIGRQADDIGLSVFLVGGMVRDLILRRQSFDVDIVVEGDGIAFASGLMVKWRDRVIKMTGHKKFRTARIDLKEGLKLDVVTARRESYARPGILPDVVPGLIADDLFRRDFTINAVAVSLNQEEFGLVHDHFDGCADIKNRIIRIMHYRSFIDDPTRILRAVRYEKRFGFKFEPRTLAVLRQALEENIFSAITPVRYFGEFKRILQEADPVAMLRRLSALSGLRFFVYNSGIEAACRSALKKNLPDDERWIHLLTALLLSFNIESAQELLTSFNMPRADKNKVLTRLSQLRVNYLKCGVKNPG